VHAGALHLAATVIALASLCVVLERLVGSLAFAAVYLAAGMAAGVISLWSIPATSTIVGASGAVFGLYGLLAAVIVHGYLRAPRPPISALAARRLAAGALLFIPYSLLSDHLGTSSELVGLATGLLTGLGIARGVTVQKPPARRSLPVAAMVAVAAISAALPLRGMIDARPEIARIAEVESHTAIEYAEAVHAFTLGRLPAKSLASVIQRNILPALEKDRSRVNGLRGVPVEQTRLVAAARRYFELREASWRRRLEGLQASSVKILREADLAERAALDHFERLRREVIVQPVS